MNISLNRPQKIAAALAPLAVTGAIIAPAAVASPAQHGKRTTAMGQTQLSQGFHVYNESSHTIRLVNITGDYFEGRPQDGAVLQPGVGYHDIEVEFRAFNEQDDTANYQILGDNGQQIGTFTVHMAVDDLNDPGSYCETTIGTCTPQKNPNNAAGYATPGKTIVLEDAANTVHNLGPDQGQIQAATLKQLCTDNNTATCTFSPTKEEHIRTSEHQVGGSVSNEDGPNDSTTTVLSSDAVDVTDSYEAGLTVGGKILGLVDVEVSAKYGHATTHSHTFQQEVTLDVPKGYVGWITDRAPVIRDTGNFTVTLGNTTWNLQGVYFDSPDPDGNGAFAVHNKKIVPSFPCNDGKC